MIEQCRKCQSEIEFGIFTKRIRCSHCKSINEIRWKPSKSNRFSLVCILLIIFICSLYKYLELDQYFVDKPFLYLIPVFIIVGALRYSFCYYKNMIKKVVTIPESRLLFLKKKRLNLLIIFLACIVLIGLILAIINFGIGFSPI